MSNLYVILILLSPLVAGPAFSDDQPRPALIGILVAVGMIAHRRERGPAISPLFLALSIFVGAAGLSLTRARLFWPGIYDVGRLAIVLGLFALVKPNRKLSALMLAVGAFAALVGLLQWAGVKWYVPPNVQKVPVVSFLGNSNYAGTFGALFLPLAIGWLLEVKLFPARVAVGVAILFLGAFIWLTGSRGGMLGAGIGCLVVIALSVRRGWVIGLAALVIASAFVPTLMRSDDPGRDVRLEIWRSSLRLWQTSPVLGVGVGRFEDAFHPFRSEREMKISGENSLVSDAHSSYVHVLVEYGAFGALAFLGWLGVFVRQALQRSRNGVQAGLVGGVAAFFVGCAFNTLHLSMPHLAFAGIMMAMLETPEPARSMWRLSWFGGALLVGALCVPLIGLALADMRYLDAIRTSSPNAREALLKSSLEMDPWSVRSQLKLADLYHAIGRSADARQAYERIVRELSPNFPDAWLRLGLVSFESKRFAEAEGAFRRAVELRPYFDLAAFWLGVALWKQGQTETAVEAFHRARRSIDVASKLREQGIEFKER